MKNLIRFILAASACIFLGCSKGSDPLAGKVQPSDYSVPENWLHIETSPSKPVDIFFMYPTAYHKANPFYSVIDDPAMRATARLQYADIASCFETVGNMYAPFYRQAGISVLDFELGQQDRIVDSIPGVDAYAAFDFFIKHYNNGRPFIIAGHSQGSNVALRAILGKYMTEHAEVYERMVAAYIIGYSVTQDFLDENPHLKFATGETDFNSIVSFNTEGEDVEEKNPVVWPGALVINPVNWKRDDTDAPASENLDSRLPDDEDSIDEPEYADARLDIERGVVICSTTDPELWDMSPVFPKGCYHNGDYPLYYYSIRKNAQDRLDAFSEAQ